MMVTGTTRNKGDAGLLSGPNHHSGRPMVRLVMAMASTLAPASTHVMKPTVRQPSESTDGDVGETCGGSNSIAPPYFGPPCQSQQ